MSKFRKIAIAGAGISGLATAIALARRGASISLFERADEIQEVGAGLQIGPNAAHALEQLGVWDVVQPITNAPEQIVIRDGQTGKLLTALPLKGAFEDRFGRSYRVAHRADLLHALLQAANSLENIEINTGTAISGIKKSTKPQLVFENRAPFHADIVIGADGINSIIRKQLFAQRAPRAAGHTIYRALIPASQVPDNPDRNSVVLWMCAGGHIVQYPLTSDRLNIVAVHESRQNLDGWSTTALSGEVGLLFQSVCTQLGDQLSGVENWLKWVGADLEPSPDWGIGNITLVGDAAHATLPYLAQGAAMALEDAVTLAHQLEDSANDPSRSLRRYEAQRHARTRRITLESRKMGQAYHLRGFGAHARNMVLQALPAAAARARLAWIYDWSPQG